MAENAAAGGAKTSAGERVTAASGLHHTFRQSGAMPSSAPTPLPTPPRPAPAQPQEAAPTAGVPPSDTPPARRISGCVFSSTICRLLFHGQGNDAGKNERPDAGKGRAGAQRDRAGLYLRTAAGALPDTSRIGRCRRCSEVFSAECSQVKMLILNCVLTLLLLGKGKMKYFDYLKKQ